MNDRIKKVIARPEVLMMGPIISPVTGVKFPVYTAVKKIYTYPDTLHVVGEEMGAVIKQIGGKKIVGGETVGIVLATAISMSANIPMCYVRKEPRQVPRYGVEGIINPGEEVVLIDDSITKGSTKIKFINNIEAAGARVSDIVVLVDVPMFGQDKDREYIYQKNIKIHSLGSWSEWFKALYKYGHLSAELAAVAIDAAQDIMKWQGDNQVAQSKWQWFEQVRLKQNNKFV